MDHGAMLHMDHGAMLHMDHGAMPITENNPGKIRTQSLLIQA